MACLRVVDPQFVQICGRIQLFRQVLRELPDYVNTCLNCLATTRGYYKGPSRLLRSELSVLGLTLFGRAVFHDRHGQSFHLVLSPLEHIFSILSRACADFVVQVFVHRKGFESLTTLDLDFCRPGPALKPNEKGLLLNQQVGAFFTEDYHAHIPGSNVNCPLCGNPDSRAHRLEHCVHTELFRQSFVPLFSNLGSASSTRKVFWSFR